MLKKSHKIICSILINIPIDESVFIKWQIQIISDKKIINVKMFLHIYEYFPL